MKFSMVQSLIELSMRFLKTPIVITCCTIQELRQIP